MTINETVKYFKEHGVKCKKIEDDRPEYGDFIAIFSYGDLGEANIIKCIADNNLLCIQFKQSIYEDERKKMMEKNEQSSNRNPRRQMVTGTLENQTT